MLPVGLSLSVPAQALCSLEKKENENAPFVLDAHDYAEIDERVKQEPSHLHTFLLRLSSTFGEVQVGQGTLFLIGRVLNKRVMSSAEFMPPECFEIWMRRQPNITIKDTLLRVAELFSEKASEKTVNPTHLEIVCSTGRRMKVYVSDHTPSASFVLDDFRLKVTAQGDSLQYALEAPEMSVLDDLSNHTLRPLPSSPEKALGSYWAHLTRGGPVSNCAELDERFQTVSRVNALYLGKNELPAGCESKLAYYCNTYRFCKQNELPEVTPVSPLGKFLTSHPFPLAASVLQVVGFLMAESGSSHCRRLHGQLDILWKSETQLHIVLPYDLVSLNEDAATVACLSDALLLFTMPEQMSNFKQSDRALDALYEALPRQAQAHFFALLCRAGFRKLTDSDLLSVPGWVAADRSTLDTVGPIFRHDPQAARYFDAVCGSPHEHVDALLIAGLPSLWSDPATLKTPALLRKAVAKMGSDTLSLALNCVMSGDFSKDEHVSLLCACLHRLQTNSSPHLVQVYSDPLRAALDRLVTPDAQIIQTLFGYTSFYEEAVSLLEKSSCYQIKFPPMKSLTDEQKRRIAGHYAKRFAEDPAVIKSLPSEEWLKMQLQTEDAWEDLARVVCVSKSSTADDLRSVAERLALTTSDVLPSFLSRVASLNAKQLTAAWKRPLAGIVASGCEGTQSLYSTLSTLCLKTPAERTFFEGCKKLPPQEAAVALTTYHQTGAPPAKKKKTLQEELEAVLKTIPASPYALNKALELLEKMPTREFRSWDLFMKALPQKPPLETVARAWKLWLAKNPVDQVHPTDGSHWFMAMFCLLKPTPQFVPFLIGDGRAVLHRVENQFCTHLTRFYLNSLHESCDGLAAFECLERLRGIQTIHEDQTLRAKIGDPINLFDPGPRATFFLLCAMQLDKAVQQYGEECFMTMISTSRDENLFFYYSTNPFVLKNEKNEERFLHWLFENWKKQHGAILWHSACQVVIAAAQLPLLQDKLARVESINIMFNDLVALGQRNRALISVAENMPGQSPLFLTAAHLFIELSVETVTDPLQRTLNLIHLHELIHKQIRTFATHDHACSLLVLCYTHVFKIAENRSIFMSEIIKLALIDLVRFKNLLSQQETEVTRECLSACFESLPVIVNDEHLNLLPQVHALACSLLETRWVADAMANQHHSYAMLLLSLVKGIDTAKSLERKKMIGELLVIIFEVCTKTDLPILTNNSLILLGNYVMTVPHDQVITPEQWDRLIGGLSSSCVNIIATTILKGTIDASKAIAVARIVRYSNISDKVEVEKLQQFCLKGLSECIRPLHPDEGMDLQIIARNFWIEALASVEERRRRFHLPPSKELDEVKETLFSEVLRFSL